MVNLLSKVLAPNVEIALETVSKDQCCGSVWIRIRSDPKQLAGSGSGTYSGSGQLRILNEFEVKLL